MPTSWDWEPRWEKDLTSEVQEVGLSAIDMIHLANEKIEAQRV